jgi:hypothetical protein
MEEFTSSAFTFETHNNKETKNPDKVNKRILKCNLAIHILSANGRRRA